jgi:RNA polymerase-interacting CarD/CdnL/TRCF family regulator
MVATEVLQEVHLHRMVQEAEVVHLLIAPQAQEVLHLLTLHHLAQAAQALLQEVAVVEADHRLVAVVAEEEAVAKTFL